MNIIRKEQDANIINIGGLKYKRTNKGSWYSQNIFHTDPTWESCYNQYLLEDEYKKLLRKLKLKRIIK